MLNITYFEETVAQFVSFLWTLLEGKDTFLRYVIIWEYMKYSCQILKWSVMSLDGGVIRLWLRQRSWRNISLTIARTVCFTEKCFLDKGSWLTNSRCYANSSDVPGNNDLERSEWEILWILKILFCPYICVTCVPICAITAENISARRFQGRFTEILRMRNCMKNSDITNSSTDEFLPRDFVAGVHTVGSYI